MSHVFVTGSFDDLRSKHMRFLHEASRLGPVRVGLWSDEAVARATGKAPKFPAAERLYVLEATRYVSEVSPVDEPDKPGALLGEIKPDIWVVDEAGDTAARRDWCGADGIELRVLSAADLSGFPQADDAGQVSGVQRKKVLVTGCYDWLHSGHVRFFEEAAQLGDLYVVVGHDANVRLLKGEGHPLFPQDERRYMVQSIRHVTQALVSTGQGWMDAEPEIARLKPDIYLVNEDGDKPEKREFCAEHGLEYVVLKRAPKPGLPKRQSTDLRGF